MTRLFIRLYLLILVGLLAIGWLGELAWRQFNTQSDQDIQQLAQLSRLIPELCQQGRSNQALQQQLHHLLKTPVQLLEMGDIQFTADQNKLLAHQEPIITYTHDDQILIYQAAGSAIFEIGPLQISHDDSGLKLLFQFISYFLLALVIAAWTWPLWRDLRKLQHATILYGKGKFNHQLTIQESSAVAPLGKSFSAMAQQIATLIAEQKQLVNAVSHDLRTPLSRIRFSLAMLSPEVQQHLPAMKQDLDELERLVDELLSYARLEHQTNQFMLDQVNICELLTHQVEKFNRQSERIVQLDIPERLVWQCDGHLLERAIQNLLSNAIKFGHQNVHVQGRIIDNELQINVQDDGPGVPEQYQQDIFNAFIRLEDSPKKATGFGLGLAIVKKICDWHGGSCQVSKAKLGGAQFTIRLPNPES